MKWILLSIGLFVAADLHAEDRPAAGKGSDRAVTVVFASTSERRSYGLLVIAQRSGCPRVRYRIAQGDGGLLGQSPPLAPGQLSVIRLGRGFPRGENRVTVVPIGCDAPPAVIRRVILANTGPDHSWRQSRTRPG